MARRVNSSGSEWEERLDRYASSGQSVARFCANEGVSVALFYYHQKKRRGRPAVRSSRTSGRRRSVSPPSLFQQIQITTKQPTAQSITVRLPCGAEFSFPQDVQLAQLILEQLLAAAPASSGGRRC